MSKHQHWQQILTDARQPLVAFLNTLTPEQWNTMVFSEGNTWRVSTIVTHLLESERGMSIQVNKARKGEQTIPDGFDIEQWNAGLTQRMGEPSPAELLAGLDATRAKTIEMMGKLTDDDWSKIGRHPSRGNITIEQYYETIAFHDRMHLADIRKALGMTA